MSLPKRPFTTSSLTSSLKSTLASQPLLNNLTNIDKLSSQASSLAQKAPFFGAINQQFLQHHHQQDQSDPQRYSADSVNPTFGQTNVTTSGNTFSSSSSGSAERISSNNRGDDMNRDVHKLNTGPGIRAPMANAPDVDMSHLTEEERAMIQSVMAKAEMADMGLPVDTSSPGSTNLPSITSEALTQQRDQQRQQQQLRQQQQQQRELQRQQQHQPTQATITGPINSEPQPVQQSMQSNLNDDTNGTVIQPQHPIHQLGVGQSQPMRGIDNPNNNLYISQRVDQPSNTTFAQGQQQVASTIMNTQSGQHQASTSAVNPSEFSLSASTMQPFPPQNSQLFNGSSIANPGGTGAFHQNNMVNSNAHLISDISNPTLSNYYQVVKDQNNNIGNISSYDMQQQSNRSSDQPIFDMPQSQASSTIDQFSTPLQVVQFGSVPNTLMGQYGNSFDQQYPRSGESFQVGFNQINQAAPAAQNIALQSLASAHRREQPKYFSASELDYEHAFSDRDQRQVRSKHSNDQSVKSMNRHESMETGRRSARRSRNRDAIELQAYDLAQRSSSGGSHKSRQLPQPGYTNHGGARQQCTQPNLQSSSEYILDDKLRGKNRDVRKSPVSQTVKPRAKLKGKSDKKIAHESSCPTESDPDDDPQTESESDSRRRPVATSHNREVKEEKAPADKETADKKTITVDSSDKSEQALKLLSELKLTEQANQVMEQQQLLIKQSQELIKLQQAQLEQQAEINKTLNEVDRDKKQGSRKGETEKTKSDRGERKLEVEGVDSDQTGTKIDPEKYTGHEISPKTEPKHDPQVYRLDEDGRTHARISTKSRADNDSDPDRRRTSRDVIKDVDSTSDLDSNWRSGGNNENSRSARAKSPLNPKVRSMSALTRKQVRDPNQSPTDTTDSDIELMSQASSRRDRSKTSVKSSKPITCIRREPKGLPPSPLPVAAAIQLHQMQQKHRNQTNWTNQLNSRRNQLRSRSVTNSPNHMLGRMMSGYMTDTQHARPTSPDTMSEYGGQRRRKRLPEPPTNVVPITPSMVRRMVQANRSAAINSGRLFNISTNSTILPPTSLDRVSIFRDDFDRRSSLNMDYKPSFDIGGPARYGSSSLLSNIQSTSSTQQTLPQQLGNSHTLSSNNTPVDSSGLNYRHKLAGYNGDDDHFLKAEQISDVKETPELDKLISNLDEYYRLDGSMSRLASPARVSYTANDAFKPNNQYESSIDQFAPIKSRPSIGSPSRVRPGTDYTILTMGKTRNPSPSYLPGHSYNPMARQNSDLTQAQASHQGYNNQRYKRQISLDARLYDLNSIDNSRLAASAADQNYPASTSYSIQQYHPAYQATGSYHDDTLGVLPRTGVTTSDAYEFRTQPVPISPSIMPAEARTSYGLANRDLNFTKASQIQSIDRPLPGYSQSSYLDARGVINYPSDYDQRRACTGRTLFPENQDLRPSNLTDRYTNHLPIITKDDIINNGPKYNSIGYRFRTENQNKYVTEPRTPIECLQSRYPYPYKRILLSKNPKDRLGNGIGVKILGGQPLPNIYDKVNKCILTSGAFVTEVFQSSKVYFMDEMHEGDQVVEWNGVNLCNRGDGEVQQILFSQFSDDEVEIIYLSRQKFKDAYGTDLMIDPHLVPDYAYDVANGTYDMCAAMNKPNSYNMHGHQVNESSKRSIRRKLSLSSISHMWSK